MIETTGLKTRSGLTFTTDVAGPADGPLVLLLHGFPESRHSWREALTALASTGFRAVAPDQRGYSPGARPAPADLANYAFDKLIDDAIEIAAQPSRIGAIVGGGIGLLLTQAIQTQKDWEEVQ